MPDAGCRMPDAGCRMPDAGCRMMIEAPGCPPRLSAATPESLRSRNGPTKNKGPVTEVTRPFGFPVSVSRTAERATFFTASKASSDENRMLS